MPVAMIVRLDKVKAVFHLSEKELSLVKMGTLAKIRVGAYLDEMFRGRVDKISPILDPLTRSASCKVGISNPKHKLSQECLPILNLL